ncbi:MAG: Hsp20/alpha crystallin family protein [Candidatus Heimdallarchaeota archaeon]|nr:MAG: Hsp20/alpha crystallin family protein [Candidatus Heimdallarchaeota archaeon]
MNQFGGFNFENLFDQMDYFLEDIFRRFNVRNPMDESSKFPGFVWGFRMTRGPDGRPHVERFGNTPRKVSTGSGFKPSLEREPLVDIIEDTNVLRVIAEIPGVSKQDVDLSATDNSLLIQAESIDKKRKYYKELDLPCLIFPDSASAKFKNGVLEVELKKKQSEVVGKKVRVE